MDQKPMIGTKVFRRRKDTIMKRFLIYVGKMFGVRLVEERELTAENFIFFPGAFPLQKCSIAVTMKDGQQLTKECDLTNKHLFSGDSLLLTVRIDCV